MYVVEARKHWTYISNEDIKMENYNLPEDHKPYADKYFLRANEILKAKNWSLWVNVEVFMRKAGQVKGINEAVEIIRKYSNIEKVGGKIFALPEGGRHGSNSKVMNIIAPVQEIIELETMYLGVIAAESTKFNDNRDFDPKAFSEKVKQVVELAGNRPVHYFGARHWRYDMDAEIAKLAFDAGVAGASTDIGAAVVGKEGVGTIPHALENIFACCKGYNKAVVETTLDFDKLIDKSVPRVALVDYANREIQDSLAVVEWFIDEGPHGENRGNFLTLRVDTCGENYMQGACVGNGPKYWTGKGVTVTGVLALRSTLDTTSTHCGGTYKDVKIFLTSGFGNPEKVRAFNDAESMFGVRLYDYLGAGFMDDIRVATADIVAVGENPEKMLSIFKAGRMPKRNTGLERIL